MANEFAVHRLNEQGLAKADRIASAFVNLLTELDAIGLVADDHHPDGSVTKAVSARERALVVTKLQEASFFAKRAMAMNGQNQVPGTER